MLYTFCNITVNYNQNKFPLKKIFFIHNFTMQHNGSMHLYTLRIKSLPLQLARHQTRQSAQRQADGPWLAPSAALLEQICSTDKRQIWLLYPCKATKKTGIDLCSLSIPCKKVFISEVSFCSRTLHNNQLPSERDTTVWSSSKCLHPWKSLEFNDPPAACALWYLGTHGKEKKNTRGPTDPYPNGSKLWHRLKEG